MRIAAVAVPAALAALVVACSSGSSGEVTGDQNQTGALSAPKRDWSAHPAIVQIDDADDIYAVSDAHGHYEMLAQLLEANHLMTAGAGGDPTKARWAGGRAVLVLAGDLIDKGDKSVEVIDLMRALEASGRGRVVVTMGNHEAEFLQDPKNDKATRTGEDSDGIDNELDADKIDPESLVKGTDIAGRGKWISSLPFGVRVKKWFFAHGGNTQQLSIKDLSKKLEDGVDGNGYGDKHITGSDSILEAENWYSSPDKDDCGKKEADALGVNHIVFGHDPKGLGVRGAIAASKNGILVKIDTAMGIHDGSTPNKAYLLHVTTKGKDTAEILDASGGSKSLL
jgi:hypothetical protein